MRVSVPAGSGSLRLPQWHCPTGLQQVRQSPIRSISSIISAFATCSAAAMNASHTKKTAARSVEAAAATAAHMTTWDSCIAALGGPYNACAASSAPYVATASAASARLRAMKNRAAVMYSSR